MPRIAIFTLRKNFDIDASMHQPRDVRSLDLTQYALLIALDKQVAKFLRESGVPESNLATWNVKDPWGPDLTEYDRVAVDLRRRILQLKNSMRSRVRNVVNASAADLGPRSSQLPPLLEAEGSLRDAHSNGRPVTGLQPARPWGGARGT